MPGVRLSPPHAAAWIALALVAGPLPAETIPHRGPTSGIFHVDRWGGARIGCYEVHPDLQPKLAAYRMKWVRAQVRACAEDLDRELPLATDIADVVPLDTNGLKADVRVFPPRPSAGERFQVVVLVENGGAEAVTLPLNAVTSQLWRPLPTPTRPRRPNQARPRYLFPSGGLSVRTYPESGRAVRIGPGERFPFVFVLDLGLEAGAYELVAWVSVEASGHSIPSEPARVELDVVPWKEQRPPKEACLLRHVLRPIEDGYEFRGRVATGLFREGAPTLDYEGDGIAVAHVRAFDRDGGEIELQRLAFAPVVREDAAEWRLREPPPEGVVTLERFRVRSRFAERPVDRLLVELITGEGMVSLPLPPFRDTHFREPPPFGPETAGVRIRIRPAAARFRSGETLRFYWQAVAATDKPVAWCQPWGRYGSYGQGTEVLIDRKWLVSPSDEATYWGGWAAAHMLSTPDESWFTLPEDDVPAPGTHTLTYVITSHGGTRQNANGRPVGLIDGRLESNRVTFTVE